MANEHRQIRHHDANGRPALENPVALFQQLQDVRVGQMLERMLAEDTVDRLASDFERVAQVGAVIDSPRGEEVDLDESGTKLGPQPRLM